MDAKAIKGIYVGECENQKASRIFVAATGKTHISRHIKVYENTNHSEPEELTNLASPVITENEEVTNSPGITELPLAETKTRKTVEPTRKSLRGRIPKKQ